MIKKIKKIYEQWCYKYHKAEMKWGVKRFASINEWLQEYGTEYHDREVWELLISKADIESVQQGLRCALKYRYEQLAFWCIEQGADAFFVEPQRDDQDRYLHLRPFEAFLMFGWGSCVKHVIEHQLKKPLGEYESEWKGHYKKTVKVVIEHLEMSNYPYLTLYGKSSEVWRLLQKEGSIDMYCQEHEPLLLYALRIGASKGLMYKLIGHWDPVWIESIIVRLRERKTSWVWYQEPITQQWLNKRLEYWRDILIKKQQRELERSVGKVVNQKESADRKRFL